MIKRLMKSVKRNIKFLYQRIRYGFDESELWSLDYTVAKFMLPRFKMFRKQHEHIWNAKEDNLGEYIEMVHGTEEDRIQYERGCEEYTEYVLDEIEWFLEQAVKGYPSDYYMKEIDGKCEFDKEKCDEYNKRFKKASELFGSHFCRLWT